MRLCNNAALAALADHVADFCCARNRPLRRRPRPPATFCATSHRRHRSGALARCRLRRRPSTGPLRKQGEGYLLHTDVEEVVLNATVLEGTAARAGPEERRFPGLRRRRQAEHHQLSAHRSSRLHRPGDRQLRLDVPQAPLGQQERARPGSGLESAGRGLRGELLR